MATCWTAKTTGMAFRPYTWMSWLHQTITYDTWRPCLPVPSGLLLEPRACTRIRAASLRCPRESRARQGHSLHHGTRFRGREKGRGHKKPTGITYGAQDAPYRGALITEALAFPTVRAVPTLRLCPTLHCGNATLQALPPGACRVPRCDVVRCGVILTHYYQVFSP